MEPKRYAILRTERLHDWNCIRKQINHAERTGNVLPKNADPERQQLNRLLFPDAPGYENAKLRWAEKVGSQHIRSNAVLGIEVFMGFSDCVTMSENQLDKWVIDSRAWLAKTFGADNVIAGAINRDEKTPHIHAFVVPIDERKRLNCRRFLGPKNSLSILQTSYANAMATHKLVRGEAGSKRTHIPQKTLYEWRNQVERQVQEVESKLDKNLTELQEIKPKVFNFNPSEIITKCANIIANTREEVRLLGELAKDAILVKRDANERERLLREKDGLAIKLVEEKTRADEALKTQAALVRGLDLVPLATEIMGLAAVEQDGKFIFTDDSHTIAIDGRKFRDEKNPSIKGSGAIDLVSKLTGRNYKGAVEYLLSKCKVAEIVADEAGKVAEAKSAELTPLKPSILTLDDIPKQIWNPRHDHWPELRKRLVDAQQFNGTLIDNLREQKMIWAVDGKTLAVSRTAVQDESRRVGVTLVPCDSPDVLPRILAPDQEGFFWLGASLDKTNRIVAVSNPLEAFAYRHLFLLHRKIESENQTLESKLVEPPHIVSLDQHVPPSFLLRHIVQAKKKLILATHAPGPASQIRNCIGNLAGQPGQFLDWLEMEELDPKPAPQAAGRAWCNIYIEKLKEVKELERIKILTRSKPRFIGDS